MVAMSAQPSSGSWLFSEEEHGRLVTETDQPDIVSRYSTVAAPTITSCRKKYIPYTVSQEVGSVELVGDSFPITLVCSSSGTKAGSRGWAHEA